MRLRVKVQVCPEVLVPCALTLRLRQMSDVTCLSTNSSQA